MTGEELMIIKKIILFFMSTGILLGASSFSWQIQSNAQEYNVKAAFLYRFSDYVEGNSMNADETFNIAILGNSNITDPLKAIATDKKIKNKRINVRQYNDAGDITGSCQMVFISKNYNSSIESVAATLYDKPALIITEQNGGCAKGAHINFFTAENKLKFEVNLRTTRRSGLKVSSQLLQHAYIYSN